MKRRFISARRINSWSIEVTYRYWFKTRTVKLIMFAEDFYKLHSDKKFKHFDTLLYKFATSGEESIHINDLN